MTLIDGDEANEAQQMDVELPLLEEIEGSELPPLEEIEGSELPPYEEEVPDLELLPLLSDVLLSHVQYEGYTTRPHFMLGF